MNYQQGIIVENKVTKGEQGGKRETEEREAFSALEERQWHAGGGGGVAGAGK